MKKPNTYHQIGILLLAIYFVTSHLGQIPDFIKGFCIGAGIAFSLIGIYAYKHDMAKFGKVKIDILRKGFGK